MVSRDLKGAVAKALMDMASNCRTVCFHNLSRRTRGSTSHLMSGATSAQPSLLLVFRHLCRQKDGMGDIPSCQCGGQTLFRACMLSGMYLPWLRLCFPSDQINAG
eukprot:5761098-Amphidinium_carterae.1